MSLDYKDFLRGKLEQIREDKDFEREKSSRAKLRDYEDRVRKANEEDAMIDREKMEKDVATIREKTKEALRRIADLKLTDENAYDKEVAEISEKGEKDIAKTKKEYEEIIDKRKRELELKALEIETELVDTDATRIETQLNFQRTTNRMIEETQDEAEKKRAENEKNAEARNLEQLDKMSERRNNQKNNALEIGQKGEEDHKKIVAAGSELESINLDLRRTLFFQRIFRSNEGNVKRLNDLVNQLNEYWETARSLFGDCIQLIRHDLDSVKFREAHSCFQDLRGEVGRMDKKILDIQKKLTCVKNDEEVTMKVKQMKEIKEQIYKLSNCVAGISGSFSMNQNPTADEKKELQELMDQLMNLMNGFEFFEHRAEFTESIKRAANLSTSVRTPAIAPHST